MKFRGQVPLLDCHYVTDRICSFIQDQLISMRRDGIVIGMSGGVDSALCAHLCVQSIGKDKVFGLILPEKDSDPKSMQYALAEVKRLGIRYEIADITTALEGLQSYQIRDEAIKEVFPEYDSSYRSKIMLPQDLLSKDSLNFYKLVIQDKEEGLKSARINNDTLRRIVSANNLKQRTRMVYLYRYAETFNYVVCGTTNRTEYMQGYFVKYGDGGVDIEPVEEFYKTQVYQLAVFHGVSKEIIDRPPTPDTFNLEVTDEEFYFRVAYKMLDVLLYAWENHVPISEVVETVELSEKQVERVYRDITSKYNATKHLRIQPPIPGFSLGEGSNT
jgi:NAD+ synthase